MPRQGGERAKLPMFHLYDASGGDSAAVHEATVLECPRLFIANVEAERCV